MNPILNLNRIMNLPKRSSTWRAAGLFAGVLAAGLGGVGAAPAAPARGSDLTGAAALAAGLRRIHPQPADPASTNAWPRLRFDADGFVRHVGAPEGHHYPPEPGRRGPEMAARGFLKRHARTFGIEHPAMELRTKKVGQQGPRHYVKLEQVHSGIPVFAAQVIVQLDSLDGVVFVTSDLLRNTRVLDERQVALEPSASREQAVGWAKAAVAGARPMVGFNGQVNQLVLYAPSILGKPGVTCLAWETEVWNGSGSIHERLLVNAATGEIALRYPRTHSALYRKIWDFNNTPQLLPPLRREEGDGATGITEVDRTYTFLGHAYNFFDSHHGRDSYDNNGAQLHGNTRYCESEDECPLKNAFWRPLTQSFYIGDAFAKDDIVAHEYTHAVTEQESGLIYEGISGAINESFSDIWGEFVDLGNASGNDSSAVRWLIAEDLEGGHIRNMKDPPEQGDPDWVGSSRYYHGSDNGDYVHINSGVNNKLCYLLTDGDEFRGYNIRGLGVSRIADLYYEANVRLLTSAADWEELYEALMQASLNLAWTIEDRNNLARACRAVGIGEPLDYHADPSTSCPQLGLPACNGFAGPYNTAIAAKAAAGYGNRIIFHGGNYRRANNTPVVFDRFVELRATDGSAVIGN